MEYLNCYPFRGGGKSETIEQNQKHHDGNCIEVPKKLTDQETFHEKKPIVAD